MISEPGMAVVSKSPPGTPAAGDRCHSCGNSCLLPTRMRPRSPSGRRSRSRSRPRCGPRTDCRRGRTVFEFLGAGYDNRSIARELGVSERTVKRHLTVILTKLTLESRLQAGLAALLISSASPDGAR
jgi:DNA-binding NarL/FixJ family response regulator